MESPETMNTGTLDTRTGPRRPTIGQVFVALVLAFAVLYPYQDATGSCGDPGCPEFSNAQAPAETVMLAAVSMAPVLERRLRRRSASDRKPAEIRLSPDPDPPRTLGGRRGFRGCVAGPGACEVFVRC